MSDLLLQIETPEVLVELMTRRGGDAYFGEPVTVLEHCLQAAFFAERDQSPETLVVAALLHDLGHLLHQQGESIANEGIDTQHEELAHQLLAAHLPASVTEPIRLHVAAKRYLCFADPIYRYALSPSSQLSLQLQGGPMTAAEAEAFAGLPFGLDAIRLRRWDDEAKVSNLIVPPISAYVPYLKTLWR